MALLKDFKTIPDMFLFLTEEYGKTANNYLLKHKVDNEYVGVSFSQFKDETEQLAMGLAALGIKSKDKVAIISENRPEWVYSDIGILSLGAIDVPLYPSLTADSIEFILNN